MGRLIILLDRYRVTGLDDNTDCTLPLLSWEIIYRGWLVYEDVWCVLWACQCRLPVIDAL